MEMKNVLHWPARPSKTQHRILGLRLRWTENSKRYRIEKFPEDGDPIFIILLDDGGWRVIAHRRNLKSAKTYCQSRFKHTERKIRVGRS
jgi:hypothetical protein